jgi:hypothetical protein
MRLKAARMSLLKPWYINLECVSMGCMNWRESRAEGRAEQKSSDLIPVQARDWLSRKRNPVRPPVSPVPAKPIFKEGMLEGRLDPHVQFQSPMETRSKSTSSIR